MKRTWTIIGVRDVPASCKWYQSLFGQPETPPAHHHFGQILDTDGTVFRLPFQERRKTIIKVTGFYTTRCIVASGPIQAEYKAMELIRHDSKLRHSVRNPRTDPPIMHAVEVRRVESFAPLKAPGTGYVFFHGRGAGRPRTMKLAPFRPNIPKDIKRAVIARFGNPARRGRN